MKVIVKIVYLLFSLFFLWYLLLPNLDFPRPLPDSLQSNEPGDMETPFRRAYYTNYSREEVMAHYMSKQENLTIFNSVFPIRRLNYPPEEAQTLIRDQTRSTFLEEIVFPFRESVYINGFEPSHPKDVIFIDGKNWKQKVTVKLIPSNVIIRTILGGISLALLYFVFKEGLFAVRELVVPKK